MAGFGLLWLAMAGSCWLSLAAREDGRKGSASFGVPEPGPMAARLLGSAGLDQSQGWSYCRGRNGSAPLAADVSFRVGGSRDGPCLANNYWPWRSGARPRVVWFSQSRLHPPEEKACPPGASSSSCPSRAWCRPAAAVQHPPARQVCRSARPATGRQVLFWFLFWSCRVGRPHLARARACLVSRLVDKDGRAWLVVDIAVRPAARSRSDPGHHTLAMSSSQHIQEVSRRARWSHLANERSISTSKGPPPAPAKARLDAMLLLGPCLFPSPPPCSHPFSLTTNC